jgi:hypothetical protein
MRRLIIRADHSSTLPTASCSFALFVVTPEEMVSRQEGRPPGLPGIMDGMLDYDQPVVREPHPPESRPVHHIQARHPGKLSDVSGYQGNHQDRGSSSNALISLEAKLRGGAAKVGSSSAPK